MFGVSLLMFSIMLYKLPGLYNEKKLKELGVFLVMWSIAFVYALLVVSDISLISPFEILSSKIKEIIIFFRN